MNVTESVAAENAVAGFVDVVVVVRVNAVGFAVAENSVVGLAVADNTVADFLVVNNVGYTAAEQSVVGFLVAETVNNAVVENVVDCALAALPLVVVAEQTAELAESLPVIIGFDSGNSRQSLADCCKQPGNHLGVDGSD